MFLDNLTDKATLKNIQSMLPNPLLKGLKPMRFPHYKQENMHSMTIRKLSQYLYIPHSPPHHVGHKELEKDLVEKRIQISIYRQSSHSTKWIELPDLFPCCQQSLTGTSLHLQCNRPQFDSWVGKIPWRRDRLPIPVFWGFHGGSDGKEPTCMQETLVQSLGREDPMEEGMTTHSSTVAWRIPMDRGACWATLGQSMGSQRVRHDWTTKHSTATITKGLISQQAHSMPFLFHPHNNPGGKQFLIPILQLVKQMKRG